MASTGSRCSRPNAPAHPTPTRAKQVYLEDELRAIVQEAAAKNVPVEAHAHGAEGALAAVKAGVRSIEHGTYLTDEALQLMAKQGTFFDPTLEALKDVADVGGDYDNHSQLRGQHMLPRLKDAIGRANKLGVKIVAGSDTGYGPSSVGRVSKEIANLVDAGLSPLAALRAATITNAEMLRLGKTDRASGVRLRGRSRRGRAQSSRSRSRRCRIRCSSSTTAGSGSTG